MATAHEIATERTGNAKFDVNVVASVIRWSRKEIRSAIAAKVEYSRDAFFRPEQARPSLAKQRNGTKLPQNIKRNQQPGCSCRSSNLGPSDLE